MLEKDKNHIYYFDYLRIICAIAVIVIHVSSGQFSNVKFFGFNWHILNIFDSISRFCVPVFVMISGALFLNKNKEISYKVLFKKYILRMVIVLVVWSLFYAFIMCIFSHGFNLRTFISNFINGHYHLWYLYMLLGLYLVLPILKKIVEDENIMKYFLILSLVFTFVIPTLLSVPKFSFLSKAFSNINFYLTLGYTSYFVLGYYLANKEFTSKQRKIIYILGILGFLFTILFTVYISFKKNSLDTRFYENYSLFVLLESIFIFVFCKYNLNELPNKKIISNLIVKLSNNSFGIYLIHALVLRVIATIYSNLGLSINCLILVPLFTFIILIISFIFTYLFKKIPFCKKYLI